MMRLVTGWLGRRTGRERALIGAAVALLLAFASWYGVLQPGMAARASAEDRLARSTLMLAEVRGMAASLAGRSEAEAAAPAPLEVMVRGAAEANGIELRSIEETEDGVVIARAQSLGSAAVLQWLEAMQDQPGLGIRSFTIRRLSDSVVDAEASFVVDAP